MNRRGSCLGQWLRELATLRNCGEFRRVSANGYQGSFEVDSSANNCCGSSTAGPHEEHREIRTDQSQVRQFCSAVRFVASPATDTRAVAGLWAQSGGYCPGFASS